MGIQVLAKGGNSGSYTAQLLTVPDYRISVAIVSTGKASGAADIAKTVLSAYLADKGLIARKAKTITPPVKAQPIPADLKSYEGYYANSSSVTKLTLDLAKGTLTGYTLEGKTNSPQLSAIYNNGYFYKDKEKYYFATFDGKHYFVQHYEFLQADKILSEKLEPTLFPQHLATAIDNQLWLRRDAKAFEGTAGVSSYTLKSYLIDALPGYIDFAGIKKVESPTFAGMAVTSSRDLTELRLFEKDGRMWAWLNGTIFMPEDLAPVLKGNNTAQVVIGTDGYNEWLKLNDDCVLCFDKPAKGRITVVSTESSALYDSAVDTGEVFAPAGSFIEVAGKPGDIFKITAKAISE